MTMREQLGIVFCPTCNEDTMPLELTGRCAWCDSQLTEPAKRPGKVPLPPEDPPLVPNGHCDYCGIELPMTTPNNVGKQRFCSSKHRHSYWAKYTERGRASWQRHNARRRAAA